MVDPIVRADHIRALSYDSVSDVIFYVALEGDDFRFRDVNEAFLRATGLRREQVVGHLVASVIPEPSRAMVLGRYRSAITERRTVHWEEVTPYPSGVKYGEVSVSPVVDETGTCLGLVGTVHDVTDAKTLERQLSVAQQITHIGSWQWDLASNVVSWSDELYRIYGFEPRSQSITFEFFLSRLLPEDRERVQREVQEALGRGGRFAYIERIARPDGSIRVLDTIGDVLEGPTGNTLGLIGTCRDVTEERQRDERLLLFAEIVRNVQIALFVWKADDEAPHTVRLVAANAAADRVLGLDLASRVGEPLETLFPAARQTGFADALDAVLRDGGVREIHAHRFPVVRTAQVFDVKVFALSGRSVGVAVEDVTARVRARELQAAERRVLEMVASSASLESVLELIVRAIEAFSPGTLASILLLDAEGTHLRHGAAPSLPDEFNRRVDGHKIGPFAGSCGTAAFERTSVFVTDIATDARWADYQDLAAIAKVRACWSTPLMATDGRVLGTFALYYREAREPSPADLELVGRATHIAQIAIQRRQLDDAMRALTGHIEAAREDERTGIAREIHDELGQALTAIKLDVAWIGRRTKSGAVEPRELQDRVDSMREMIDGLIHRVRRISSELRPGVLDDLGLEAAVEWQCREFEKRTGVSCVLESKLDRPEIDRNLATAFFRMLQESLTNVARHANAAHVHVRLACENERLWLEVRDDGRGISRQAITSPKSLGLLGIQERARRVGGVLAIESLDPHGTSVRMEAPFVRAVREGMR